MRRPGAADPDGATAPGGHRLDYQDGRVADFRPDSDTRVLVPDRKAPGRSLEAVRPGGSGADLGDRDPLGLPACALDRAGRRSRRLRGPEPDRLAAALGLRRPASGSHGRNRVAVHPGRVHRGDRRSLRGGTRPGAPAAALACGSVRVHRGRRARRFPDHRPVRPGRRDRVGAASVAFMLPPIAIGIAVIAIACTRSTGSSAAACRGRCSAGCS